MKNFSSFLKAPLFWERTSFFSILLLPLTFLFYIIVSVRQWAYKRGLLDSEALPVPNIIVGNIRVGGTGKTPIVMALARALYWRGFCPGIISRGYLATSQSSQKVKAHDNPKQVGDEPLLMAKHLEIFRIPVWTGRNRVETAKAMLKDTPSVNVILCDDGLQHYALKRTPAREGGFDVEIVVRDVRQEGNSYLLPAGPLREPVSRARDVTLNLQMSDQASPEQTVPQTIPNTYEILLHFKEAYQLQQPELRKPVSSFSGHAILALAGIAYPEKFFTALEQQNLTIERLALPDHFDFQDFAIRNEIPTSVDYILLTEKDAVKCQSWNDPRIWVVPLEADIPNSLVYWLSIVLHRHSHIPLIAKT